MDSDPKQPKQRGREGPTDNTENTANKTQVKKPKRDESPFATREKCLRKKLACYRIPKGLRMDVLMCRGNCFSCYRVGPVWHGCATCFDPSRRSKEGFEDKCRGIFWPIKVQEFPRLDLAFSLRSVRTSMILKQTTIGLQALGE